MSLAIRRTGLSFRSGTRLGSRKQWRRRAEENEDRIDEETLDRLKRAEEEAAELRREVASLKAYQEKQDALAKAGRTFWGGSKLDSGDLKRETILDDNTKSGNWLSEREVGSLVGDEDGLSPEERETVNRRLAVGGTIGAVFVGLSFVPQEKFNFLKPKGSVVDYLVPIIRSQDLLAESEGLVEEAQWDQVRVVVDRIVGSPNKIRSNMESAVAFLAKDEDRARGRALISEVMEFVQEVDYNRYFEDRLNVYRFKGGAEEMKFVEFSLNSVKTAEKRLQRLLSLFPPEDVETAKGRIPSLSQ